MGKKIEYILKRRGFSLLSDADFSLKGVAEDAGAIERSRKIIEKDAKEYRSEQNYTLVKRTEREVRLPPELRVVNEGRDVHRPFDPTMMDRLGKE